MEHLIILFLVIASGLFLFRHFSRPFKAQTDACAGGCQSCAVADKTKAIQKDLG